MQVFEVLEVEEFPHMAINEIFEGETVRDILENDNEDRVFLIIDHDSKMIYMWNGQKSSFKLQIYGGILARKMRQQLRLFYRVYSLNAYSKDDKKYQDVIEKKLGGGIAKSFEKKDFMEKQYGSSARLDITIATNIDINKAIEYINDIPPPENYIRKFFLISGNVYTEEDVVETFVQKEKIIKIPFKMGVLNRGFTFFSDYDYSTRLIINDRQIQGIELYIHENDKSKIQTLNLKIPIFSEERFFSPGVITDVLNAFKIPDRISEEENNQNLVQNQKES
ncbi:MAG: hypothetical protein ACFFDK_05485 [Promethearchaeota archaeon]